MNRNLAATTSVAALAAAVGLSPSRFAHLFRTELGISPVRYLRAQRLARARILLERTSLPVNAVMRRVGFTDPSHFTRDFRRAHGTSPVALRQQYPLASRTTQDVAASANDQQESPTRSERRRCEEPSQLTAKT